MAAVAALRGCGSVVGSLSHGVTGDLGSTWPMYVCKFSTRARGHEEQRYGYLKKKKRGNTCLAKKGK